MKPIAFLTMDNLDRFVSYDTLVADCLAEQGVKVENVPWRSQTVRWDNFGMVIIRSPWDYQQSADEFLTVLRNIDASEAVLWNPVEVVRWNIRKTYLQELRDHGIEIVPTEFVQSPTELQLRSMFEVFETDQIVIKPVVGAGADQTFRLHSDGSATDLQQIELVFANRLALIQPFISSVIEYGETSLVFFDGQYSHSVLKTPKPGDFRVQEEHGSRIQSLPANPAHIEFAERALERVPQHTLYGRVDLVELPNGQPAVMELELIEPSLYLSYDADSAARFAEVILRFRA